MAIKKIDARGKACPEPVILAKKALSEPDARVVTVLVDNETARDNVRRMAENEGCRVEISERGKEDYELKITRGAGKPSAPGEYSCSPPDSSLRTYLLNSDHIGANRELGKVLVKGLLNAAVELPGPKQLVFINTGVKLVTEESYCLEVLEKLENSGARILVCGTCVDYFKLRDKIKAGNISNALEIMETLSGPGKLISL
ncbi:MAG: sulfurtransferase-like selenium metabolism protein YedF [Proteobacteria bacterium]|nr:sulfurtransferase-like selenium metabolism protein YedF [Pseudomonadota bacterium]